MKAQVLLACSPDQTRPFAVAVEDNLPRPFETGMWELIAGAEVVGSAFQYLEGVQLLIDGRFYATGNCFSIEIRNDEPLLLRVAQKL